MTIGYVTFELAGRTLATPLVDVREIVRLQGLEALPDMRPPFAGILTLRGVPLPVLDLRPEAGRRGDVLVMRLHGEPTGICVDKVVAVHEDDQLVLQSGGSAGMPDYVTGVLRGPDGPVLLVDLGVMAAEPVSA